MARDATTMLLVAHCALLVGILMAVIGAANLACAGACPGAQYLQIAGAMFGIIVVVDLAWAVLAWQEVRRVRDPVAKRALGVGLVVMPMVAWYVAVVRWNDPSA